MKYFKFLPIFYAFTMVSSSEMNFVPCPEISPELNFPCRCGLGPTERELDDNPALYVDCDRVVLGSDFPNLPYGAPVVSFRQRHAGHQALPTQVLSSASLPIRILDFSGNSLRRLTERLLIRLQGTLVELRLAENLLGDTLNPIFSSNEFHGLKHLQILDLSSNGIKALEEGILEGCESLQELYLDRNSFKAIPTSSLNGPKALRILSLKENRIGLLKSGSFYNQKQLEHIDLSQNLIGNIEGDSFIGLSNLKTLRLANNKLARFNSDVFQGIENVHLLDLTDNFLTEFPAVALKAFSNLRYLNLSSNLIQHLDGSELSAFGSLYHLDIKRNNIANILPGTFLGLKQLRKLDISVNSLRTIEDDAFEGLDNLETLILHDNNILLLPASAFGRLPHLTTLYLDYNRVAALSGDILRSVAERVTKLSIAKNVVRELPSGTFEYFQQLEELDLTRNLLTTLNTEALGGLEKTLKKLHLSQNHISTIIGPQLALTALEVLDLSDNNLAELPRNAFSSLTNLKHLNLSGNKHLSYIPSSFVQKLVHLVTIDLSDTGLKTLSPDLFSKTRKLRNIFLQNNEITEIVDNTFANLRNLSVVDLSFNKINNIKQGAFVNVMNMKKLILKGNELNAFKGEIFNTGTSIEIIDISDNQLNYLFPSSFRIHPRLKELYVRNNKFTFFPAELIASLQYLEIVDLSENNLKNIEEFDFARLPRLRKLLLRKNIIESISEMAFHNSTQLQILDLSYNKIERLTERLFEGLIRLELLDLEGNQLADLPDTIFERARLQMLENINLARNLFEIAPLKPLQRQYFFVNSVDLSHNKLVNIPAEDSLMVNIKKLDLSYNPLSEQSVMNVLGEPKTVREINLAGTNISRITRLETPFLNYLNLSHNNISELSETTFERTSLLEHLDLSYNQLSEMFTSFSKVWALLNNLQSLDLSYNPIKSISQMDFEGLESLKVLKLHDLNQCSRIDKSAFKFVPNLSVLEAHNFPKVGYIDIKGLVQNLPALEKISIETKDPAIGSDHLQSILRYRLKEITITGQRLHSVSSGTLSGLKSPEVLIRLLNTSISSLPPALFFPVPRSSKITLDLQGNQITTISPQMLTVLDDRRGDLKIVGLESNPITCDCSAKAFRRWISLTSSMTHLKCTKPDHLSKKLLIEVDEKEFSCDPRKPSTSPPLSTVSKSKTTVFSKSTEPEIIWSLAPTTKSKPNGLTTKKPLTASINPGNDDTLIIGIVGGVVAFITALIIIICIIRLRATTRYPPGGPVGMVNGTVPHSTGSNCACSVKGAPIYAIPQYGPGYAATLPHKMHNMSVTPRPAYSTMGRSPYGSQAYYVAYPADDKTYR